MCRPKRTIRCVGIRFPADSAPRNVRRASRIAWCPSPKRGCPPCDVGNSPRVPACPSRNGSSPPHHACCAPRDGPSSPRGGKSSRFVKSKAFFEKSKALFPSDQQRSGEKRAFDVCIPSRLGQNGSGPSTQRNQLPPFISMPYDPARPHGHATIEAACTRDILRGRATQRARGAS